MNLLIIKHGKTDLNLEGKRQGRSDLPLNDTGIREVNELKSKITGDCSLIIASPLKRTLETAQMLFPGREIVTDDLLLEFDFGELEGEPFTKTPEDFPNNKTIIYNEIEFILPNEGETFEEITKRCEQFLDWLKEHHPENAKVAIVTHSTNIEILKALIERKPWYIYLGQAKTFHGFVELEL